VGRIDISGEEIQRVICGVSLRLNRHFNPAMHPDFLRYKKRYENYWNKRKVLPKKIPELYARFLDEEEFLMFQEKRRKEDILLASSIVLCVIFLLFLLARIVWKMIHH
jgi:ABC-type uncharacterized transport system involved in gliding motility auxiliary subunit